MVSDFSKMSQKKFWRQRLFVDGLGNGKGECYENANSESNPETGNDVLKG